MNEHRPRFGDFLPSEQSLILQARVCRFQTFMAMRDPEGTWVLCGVSIMRMPAKTPEPPKDPRYTLYLGPIDEIELNETNPERPDA